METNVKIERLKEYKYIGDKIATLTSENLALKDMLALLENFQIEKKTTVCDELNNTVIKNEKEIAALQKDADEITLAIKALTNRREASILTARYIRCQTWKTIANSRHYSRMQATRIHDAAIEHINL